LITGFDCQLKPNNNLPCGEISLRLYGRQVAGRQSIYFVHTEIFMALCVRVDDERILINFAVHMYFRGSRALSDTATSHSSPAH